MNKRPYHRYTECDSRYACIKRLGFIVDAVTRLEKEKSRKLDILEIGCGNGNVALPVASLGHHVWAADVDPVSVNVAKRKNEFPNAHFFVSDGEALQVRKTFDVIIATEVLEHVRAPDRLLAVCEQLLEPLGILILTVPNGYGPFELAVYGLILGGRFLRFLRLRRLLDYVKTAWFAGARRDSYISANPESYHAQHFMLEDIRSLLAEAGFRIVQVGHSDFLTPVLELPLRFRVPERLHHIDWRVADRLPHSMVSGWYFLCRTARSPEGC